METKKKKKKFLKSENLKYETNYGRQQREKKRNKKMKEKLENSCDLESRNVRMVNQKV